MKCPHCRVHFAGSIRLESLGGDVQGEWRVAHEVCPNCKRRIIHLMTPDVVGLGAVQIWPRTTDRNPAPPEVPQRLANDYGEACLVLPVSAKASAALSRRCLQYLLREYAKVTPSNLADEIEEVMNKHSLPSHLAEAIDAIRNIGNFAAHPIKSQRTGEIIEVEPGEADWTLDVLESLFDFYFVQPELLKKKKAALNEKLTEAGKKPMT